jgi:hypothetical protein
LHERDGGVFVRGVRWRLAGWVGEEGERGGGKEKTMDAATRAIAEA